MSILKGGLVSVDLQNSVRPSSTIKLRVFTSLMLLASFVLTLAGPISSSVQAASATTAPASTPGKVTRQQSPHSASGLDTPFPRLGAPYVNAGPYPSGDIYIGCCNSSGGSRSLAPMLNFQLLNVGEGDDTVPGNPGDPRSGEDFRYLRTNRPDMIMLNYIDDRELSTGDPDYSNSCCANLAKNHPEYFLHDTNGNLLYFDTGFVMWNLTNPATLQYLENRVKSRLDNAPTVDGFYVDGNDGSLSVTAKPKGWQVNIDWPNPTPSTTDYNVIDAKWLANENAFLAYISSYPRNHAGAPNGNNVQVSKALVLANASKVWDYYDPYTSFNGSLNTDSVNETEVGTYNLNGVLYGYKDTSGAQIPGYLADVANSSKPVITTMTVDGSPYWQDLSKEPAGYDDATAARTNYRRMRYGLTTTLMGDGFFQYNQNYNYVGVDPVSPWWYDEYNNGNAQNPGQGLGYLGSPLGNPYHANVTSGAAGLQVVNDGGFEQKSGEWTAFTPALSSPDNTAQASFSFDTNVVHSGAVSGRLNVSVADNYQYGIYAASIAHNHDISLVQGHHYSVSFWLRADANRPVQMKLFGTNANSPYFQTPGITDAGLIQVPADNNWHQFTYSFVAPQTDPNAQMVIQSGTVRGNLWVDDMAINDTDVQPSVFERDFDGGTALVNGTSSAVTVQLSKPYKHINGTQDRTVNDGSVTSSVTIQPFDGVVLVNGPSYPGCTASCTNYNLPLVANNASTAVGSTTTFVTVQNLSGNTANITVQYYNPTDGSPTTKQTLQIPAKGQQVVPGIGTGQSYTGIASSDQPLNVIVSEGLSTGGSAYNVSATTSSTLYDPIALNGQYGFTTAITVFNAGSSANSGTINFYDESGNLVSGAAQSFNLAAHAAQTFNQSAANSGLNGQHSYSAKIAGSGTGLTAQVIEFGPANFVASFNSVPQSQLQTKVYAPAVFNGAFGSFVTGMALANPNGSPANVTLSYFDANGGPVTQQNLTIPANGVSGVYQPFVNGLSSGFNGSATITSSQPLAVTVNERAGGSVAGTYVALTGGSQNIGLPVMAGGAFGFTTGTTILNVSSSTASVTLTYLDGNGNTVGTQAKSVAPNASFQLFQGDVGQVLPPGFFGTAIVSSSVPDSLMATTNALNSNGLFYTYTDPAA